MKSHRQSPVKMAYSTARRLIRDGDLLQFDHGMGLMSFLIPVAGRSRKSHSGMAVDLNIDDCRKLNAKYPGRKFRPGLHCAHTIQGRGGRLDLLSEIVEKYPGRITVRKPLPELDGTRFNRRKAKAEILKIIGLPYGWLAIERTALTHLPIIRVLLWRYILKFMVDDGGNGGFPFCSMAVSRACRAAGLDPVPNLGDGWTEPGDLSRSAVFYDWAVLVPKKPAKPKQRKKAVAARPAGKLVRH